MAIHRLFVAGGLLIDGLDLVALRGRQVGFRAGSFIGRERVGQRPGLGLPDAAFHACLVRQGEADGVRQVGAQLDVELALLRSGPARRVEPVAIPDQVARVRNNGFGTANLRFGRLLVELQQQKSDRDTGGERESPKAHEPVS